MRTFLCTLCFCFATASLAAAPSLSNVLRPVEEPSAKPSTTKAESTEKAETPVVKERVQPRRLEDSEILEELVFLLAEVIDWEGDLRIAPVRPLPRVHVLPDWELRYTGTPPPLLNNRMNLHFEIWSNGRSLGSWRLPFRVELWKETWTARQRIRRGEALHRDVLERALTDVLSERNPPITSDTPLQGLEATNTIMEGRTLSWGDVQQRPAVRRGERIEVFVRNGSLSISMPAQSTEDGHVGDLITVRNIQSKREIQAVITATGRAEVQLN
ncbi:MAG: flagellar basal body P-ring formation protein FlgA [Opitutales bacterium]|nr:flagellar basal body P-ring formation protein FlgA [Opitutales bacterium]